jgi:hypothetical protein
VERPSASGDGCGAGLWDGIGRRARADRREGSGGYTRCSRRYGRGDRVGRVKDRVLVRPKAPGEGKGVGGAKFLELKVGMVQS